MAPATAAELKRKWCTNRSEEQEHKEKKQIIT